VLKKFLISLLFIFILFPIFSQNGDNNIIEESTWIDHEIEENDFVYHVVLNNLDLRLYEIINVDFYENGIPYSVYKYNDEVMITVSIDNNNLHYLIGNVESYKAMLDILEYLTSIYSEPVPYLDGEGFVAYFYDIENKYIKDDFPDYIGTFTVYSNQLFVEEVITQEKIIIQRQWCTPDFYEITVVENGKDWGFIASWEEIEIVFDEPEQDMPSSMLPVQYTVRSWKETGDSFSAIAEMPFIYGDSIHWRILYDANKSKLPRQNNPHLIYPGTILDIPSLNGEERSGMWNHDTQSSEK